MKKPLEGSSGAEAFVETLNALGIDRVFLNPGIDLVPLIAFIARCRASERKAPRVILCPDESVAVTAAHGYAMVSGTPQVVAVFEDVGTLQGGGAIVNLKYGRAPVILCAGANSIPDRLNWQQEPADQRRIVRDYVKWDHEVTANDDISSVLKEAYRVAAEPCGPVYLTFASGVLMGKAGKGQVSAFAADHGLTALDADTTGLAAAADMLVAAANPLIMSAYSGRHPESVKSLVDIAETLGSRAITTDLRMNFPSTHPLCPGIDAIKGDAYDHYICDADVLLVVDYNFPGPVAKRTVPGGSAKIIHIDMEPLKNGKPLWGRQPDVLIQGNSARILPALDERIKQSLSPGQRARCKERSERIAEEHKRVKAGWQALADADARKKPISAEWLCRCIDEAIDDDAIVVHMIPSTADALSHQLRRTKAGTIFSWGENAGSMGWALGAALGAKLAAPDSMVVSLIGDGGFIYGCPVATLWSASAYRAPFLTIIFNNHAYAVFREIMPMFGGPDLITGEMGFEVGIDMPNPPDFAAIARACNAYGQGVEEPSDLAPALKAALDEVRGGRSAVLDVKI